MFVQTVTHFNVFLCFCFSTNPEHFILNYQNEFIANQNSLCVAVRTVGSHCVFVSCGVSTNHYLFSQWQIHDIFIILNVILRIVIFFFLLHIVITSTTSHHIFSQFSIKILSGSSASSRGGQKKETYVFIM